MKFYVTKRFLLFFEFIDYNICILFLLNLMNTLLQIILFNLLAIIFIVFAIKYIHNEQTKV